MEVKPLRIIPSSDHRTGEGSEPQMKIDSGWTMGSVTEKMVEVKEEVELDLGVADYSATAKSPVVFARGRCLFTESQRHELQHQFFIFRHFESGLPVPLNFVLPIVRSVADTFRPDLGGFYKLFSSFLSFEYKGMVDPEPRRCRRTDGKKWRCSKNTVPGQKYCEQHMHRGCKRSRKHVETPQVNSSSITKPSGNFQAKLGYTESLVPNPVGIQFDATYSVTPSHGLCSSDSIWPADRCKNNIVSADTQNSYLPSTAGFPSSMPATAAKSVHGLASVPSRNNSSLNIDEKVDNARSFICNNRSRNRSNRKGNIIGDNNNISTGVDFSPRSVLQAINVSGSNNSSLNYSNSVEHEPGRCRRTDGKKWQCRSSVLPGQKYCARHMHRGAKKRLQDQESATMSLSSSVATTVARTMPCIQKAYCTIPKTNLSMSIPASVSQVQHNEKSTSSGDSDTTISDNIIEYSYFSA